MGFDRSIWLNWKTRKPCPNCNTGILLPQQTNGLLKHETQASKEYNEYGGYYRTDYIFSVHLKCNNCSDTVAVSGFMSEEDTRYDEEDGGIYTSISPVCFFPAPKIIEIPASCPVSVSKLLNASFGLYWLDVSSCANKIRISIEVLLDELGVIKSRTTKKGTQRLTLHKRIEEYQTQNPEVGDFLLAIKWIGNDGSHLSEVKKEDVLDAYELLEYSLEVLYNDRKEKLIEISKKINNSRR